jgi:hypothetical protein
MSLLDFYLPLRQASMLFGLCANIFGMLTTFVLNARLDQVIEDIVTIQLYNDTYC